VKESVDHSGYLKVELRKNLKPEQREETKTEKFREVKRRVVVDR
jgi:hypothetical protein